jgi:hypothetical protein
MLRTLRPVFRSLPPQLVDHHEAFRAAVDGTYASHRYICERFVGDDRSSLLAGDRSRRSAVSVLEQFRRYRLADVSPSAGDEDDPGVYWHD